jgi:hypothetical protein
MAAGLCRAVDLAGRYSKKSGGTNGAAAPFSTNA